MENTNNIEFLKTVDVARIMGICVPTARQVMQRKDFPLVKTGKNLKVEKNAFLEWCKSRHE